MPPAQAEAWAQALVDLVQPSEELAATVVQIAARTGDLARDLDEDVCRALHARLVSAGVPDAALVRLIEIHAPSRGEAARAYGESLPEGLRLV